MRTQVDMAQDERRCCPAARICVIFLLTRAHEACPSHSAHYALQEQPVWYRRSASQYRQSSVLRKITVRIFLRGYSYYSTGLLEPAGGQSGPGAARP